MNNSLKTLLLLSAILSLAYSHYDHAAPCSHTQYQAQNPPDLLDIEEDVSAMGKDRMLQSASASPIRIYAYYGELQKITSSSFTSYVQDLLAPAVISYFQGAIKVKYPVSGNLKLDVSSICGMSTPSDLQNGVAADYAILYNAYSESSDVVANSMYCYLASGTKRPLVATTNFNTQMFIPANGDVILHEKNTYLLLHEMTHTFGFSVSMYKYFIDASGNTLTGHVTSVKIAGNTHTVVNVSPLTDKIRTFHGCSTIPGAIMEDNGGSGTDDSHFEKKFYIFDTMATGSSSGKRTSELSLALLEGSGWYEIDYTYAEPYFYGQGEGCDFINGQCSSSGTPEFPEFCNDSGRECAFVGHSGGSCYSDSKTNGCKYVNPNNNYHCENPDAVQNARLGSVEVYGRGLGSKCFSGTLNTKSSSSSKTSFCFQFNCVGSGTDTQLQVILGATTATCTSEGSMTVDGYTGTINCPDPLTFCNTVGKKYCPRNCMGRGSCVNNECVCDAGFGGVDCALIDSSNTNTNTNTNTGTNTNTNENDNTNTNTNENDNGNTNTNNTGTNTNTNTNTNTGTNTNTNDNSNNNNNNNSNINDNNNNNNGNNNNDNNNYRNNNNNNNRNTNNNDHGHDNENGDDERRRG